MTQDTESKTNWTPGPWEAIWGDELTGIYAATAIGGVKEIIARVYPVHTVTGEREANSHLIAAAPLLYEALEELAKATAIDVDVRWDTNPHIKAALPKVTAALAAARGEQP